MKHRGVVFFVILCAVGALSAGAAVYFPTLFHPQEEKKYPGTRVIVPWRGDFEREEDILGEELAQGDEFSLRLPLEEGEILISILSGDFDMDSREEQIIAYRNLSGQDNPIEVAFIDYDDAVRQYCRVWSAPTAATQPLTVSLYTQDIIGDRSLCILLSGMNGQGEHTLTIFRKVPAKTGRGKAEGADFVTIAEIRIDGLIQVQETLRSTAYQQGLTQGRSFSIAAYGRDPDSANLLDQVEILYQFNPKKGVYEESKVTHVPGVQVEQRQVRQLLSGSPGVFENFISGLWYYVSPQGTLDSRQYIYFDPMNRELIFYGEGTQQVFSWQGSSPTRYGLYIAAQNISVITLRRFLDIELESLSSLRVKVHEEVKLKIGVSNPWDGSYRRAAPIKPIETPESPPATLEAAYDSSIGRFRFHADGSFEIHAGGAPEGAWVGGRYAFFSLGKEELLELRSGPGNRERKVYRIEGNASRRGEDGKVIPRQTMTLIRVRLGAQGVSDFHEGPISLNLTEEGQG